jgi:dipeptidyl aminopeptidase/acylaminoacyl peptidase
MVSEVVSRSLQDGRRATSWRFCLLLALLGGALLTQAAAAASSHAVGFRAFDPVLSLTGGTETSAMDPVPDPGSSHPPTVFREPCGVAVDSHGNVYVASYGPAGSADHGRIDIFNPMGEYLTSIADGHAFCGVAVDSLGNVYVVHQGNNTLVRYPPSSFPPTSDVTYGSPVELFHRGAALSRSVPAVDPRNNHVYVPVSEGVDKGRVIELGSAVEGNPVLDEIGLGILHSPNRAAVDPINGDLFVGSGYYGKVTYPSPEDPFPTAVFVFDEDGQLKTTIDGSDTPVGGFGAPEGLATPAVDPHTGEVLVAEFYKAKRVFRFVPTAEGDYEYAPDPELEDHSYSGLDPGSIAVANAPGQPNDGYAFVTSANPAVGHLFAFTPPRETGPPAVSATSFRDVSETEATLVAEVSPHGRSTLVHFEYVEETRFDISGFAEAVATPGRPIGDGQQPVTVSQGLSGLTPGITYRFRIVADNCGEAAPSPQCRTEGERKANGTGPEIVHRFGTYPPPPLACPNQLSRWGPSAALPDCRSYERVSPSDAAGRDVTAGIGGSSASAFPYSTATPDGEAVFFETQSGSLPGFSGTGARDRYLARRTANGWATVLHGPTGAESERPEPGSISADLRTAFWTISQPPTSETPDHGSLGIDGANALYLHRSSTGFELVGQGTLAVEPAVFGKWISSDGEHVIFTGTKALEPGATSFPGEAEYVGTGNIYDRTSDGTVHVVSLLPGNLPPEQVPRYLGASADGSVVAFEVDSTTYLRLDNAKTIEVGNFLNFAGLSSDGSVFTYTQGGDVFSFNTSSGVATPIGSGGKSTLVNVSADGSHVYFISSSVLASPGAKKGKNNLYVGDARTGGISYIATVTPTDVVGEKHGEMFFDGLGLWMDAVSATAIPSRGPGSSIARTTADGRYLLFGSRADLTDEAAGGELQLYRYDSQSGSLLCVSCNPTLAVTSEGARLQTVPSIDPGTPINALTLMANLSDDGSRAFFESSDALVAADVNGVQDAYQWQAPGTGGCSRGQGCIALISSGRGTEPNYLFGIAAGGRDVFFASSEALVPSVEGGTQAIYDARVNGGFPSPLLEAPCRLESCQGTGTMLVSPPAPASAGIFGRQEKRRLKRCPKGKRRVVRNGKARCVVKKRARAKQRRHHANKSGEGSK